MVDTGLGEDDDPVIATVLAHPRVTGAQHPDREYYLWQVSAPMTAPGAGALVLRALLAGHGHALRSTGLDLGQVD